MATTLDADYVVYGAGAMGMAFIDTLMTESTARVILVDKHGQPGGHWNDAYGYVRLHQPSAYYGVNSRDLQRDKKDYLALASRNEVLAYYESVISKFVANGRVQYFPMCQCSDPSTSRSFYSLVQEGKTYQIASRAKIVNATYLQCIVPSISRADTRYGIAEGVKVVPLNELPKMGQAWPAYCVVGSGKTGMDCVLWLLDNGVDSSRIKWISPNDSWCMMRDSITPDGQLRELKNYIEPFCTASTVEEFYTGLEGNLFHRIDPKVRPTKNKCATVSTSEMAKLRTVQMTRLGRVKRIEQDRVCLEKGDSPSENGTLYVDCSTDGLAARPPIPVFKGETITLQSISLCQQVFSAALIAHIEIKFGADEAKKNSLTAPVPHPTFEGDYITNLAIAMKNKQAWGKAGLNGWLNKSRLNSESHYPSCGACFAFLCSDLCKTKRLFKGMNRVEQDLVENLTKLAEQVEKRK